MEEGRTFGFAKVKKFSKNRINTTPNQSVKGLNSFI